MCMPKRWARDSFPIKSLMMCFGLTVLTVSAGMLYHLQWRTNPIYLREQSAVHDIEVGFVVTEANVSESSGNLTVTVERTGLSTIPISLSVSTVSITATDFVVTAEDSGYAISLSFWEQLTMSVMNLLDFQCWAATNGLVVVQPLLFGPYAQFTFSNSLSQSWSTLDSVYNMSDWNRHSLRSGLSSLIDREVFLNLTMKRQMKVILVQFQPAKIAECSFHWTEHAGEGFLSTVKQWEIVKTVCTPYRQLSFETFNNLIFGSINKRGVIVIFNIWPGFEPIYIPRAISMCKEGRKFVCKKPPSERLLRDASQYADEYLGGFGNYLAIAARFEKPVANYWELNPQQCKQAITNRIKESTEAWEGLKRKTSLSSTFLGLDYGSFGSDTFKRKRYCQSEDILEQFHQTIYENRLSLKEWEESFEKVTHTNHTAYITLLQLQIAAHAKCLVIVGMWSNYHKVVHQTYLRLHPNNPCVRIVGAVDHNYC